MPHFHMVSHCLGSMLAWSLSHMPPPPPAPTERNKERNERKKERQRQKGIMNDIKEKRHRKKDSKKK